MGKKAILISAMVACVAGTVGSVFALTRVQAQAEGTSGAFDQAIYLYWDSEQDSKVVPAIEHLGINTPVYRYLTVSPKSTKSVSGNVTLTFTLEEKTGNFSLDGLTVDVYKTASLATDETVATLTEGVVAEPALSSTKLTGTTKFAVAAAENAHETTAYYAIKVNYDGTDLQGKVVGAKLTISQSFGA